MWRRSNLLKSGGKEKIEYWYNGLHYTFNGEKWESNPREFASLPNSSCGKFLIEFEKFLCNTDFFSKFSCSRYETSTFAYPSEFGYNYTFVLKDRNSENRPDIVRVEIGTDGESDVNMLEIVYANGGWVNMSRLSVEDWLFYDYCDLMNHDMGEASPLAGMEMPSWWTTVRGVS